MSTPDSCRLNLPRQIGVGFLTRRPVPNGTSDRPGRAGTVDGLVDDGGRRDKRRCAGRRGNAMHILVRESISRYTFRLDMELVGQPLALQGSPQASDSLFRPPSPVYGNASESLVMRTTPETIMGSGCPHERVTINIGKGGQSSPHCSAIANLRGVAKPSGLRLTVPFHRRCGRVTTITPAHSWAASIYRQIEPRDDQNEPSGLSSLAAFEIP